jgi:hypothetical protein
MPARIAALMEERKKLERDLSDARKKLAMGGGATNGGAAAGGVREAGGVKLLARAVEGVETKDLKSLVDDGKKQIGSGVVAIVGVTEDGKAGIVVGVTSDLTSRFNAVELVRKGSEALGGKGGGGRPDMAQAGGPDGAKASAALSAIEQAIRAHPEVPKYWLDGALIELHALAVEAVDDRRAHPARELNLGRQRTIVEVLIALQVEQRVFAMHFVKFLRDPVDQDVIPILATETVVAIARREYRAARASAAAAARAVPRRRSGNAQEREYEHDSLCEIRNRSHPVSIGLIESFDWTGRPLPLYL